MEWQWSAYAGVAETPLHHSATTASATDPGSLAREKMADLGFTEEPSLLKRNLDLGFNPVSAVAALYFGSSRDFLQETSLLGKVVRRHAG